jgi:tetratricopeptide (TPR) repeat protein
MYLITGPPGVGKSIFLLHSIAHAVPRSSRLWGWLSVLKRTRQKGAQTLQRVLFLNPQASESWGESLTVEDLVSVIAVLDGARRPWDTTEAYRSRLNALANLAGGTLEIDGEPSTPVTCRIALTLRDEDLTELQRSPPFGWPSSSDVCTIRINPFQPDSVDFGRLVKHYTDVFRVDVGGEGRLKEVTSVLAERSGGNPYYVISFLSELQDRQLTVEQARRLPQGIIELNTKHIASHYWVEAGDNKALCFTLCLLTKSRRSQSKNFLRLAWDELGGRQSVFDSLLKNLISPTIDARYTLSSQQRCVIQSLISSPDRIEVVHDLVQYLAAYAQDRFEQDLKNVIQCSLNRVASQGVMRSTIWLLEDCAEHGEEFLHQATQILERFRTFLDPLAMVRLSRRFYEEWAYVARIHRRKQRYQDAISSYKEAFKFYKAQAIDWKLYRIDLHAYLSLYRRFELPALTLEERPTAVNELQRMFDELFSIERSMVEEGTLLVEDRQTITEYANFLWNTGDYPYTEAEHQFEKAVKMITGESAHEIAKLCVSMQAYAVFLHERAQDGFLRQDSNLFSQDYEKADQLFKDIGDRLANIREKQGQLPRELCPIESAYLIASAEFHLDRAAKLSAADIPRAQEEDRIALAILRTATKRYKKSTRPANALSKALCKVGQYLPEERARWFQEARECLEGAITVALEQELYHQASISVSELALLLSDPSHRLYNLAVERLKQALQWRLLSKQAGRLRVQLAMIYQRWTVWVIRQPSTSSSFVENLIGKAHNELSRSLDNVPETVNNYDHIVRVCCAWAQHYRLAGKRAEAKSHLEKAASLARQIPISLSRMMKDVCEVAEELLELDDNPEGALRLFEAGIYWSHELQLPTVAKSRLNGGRAKSLCRLARYDEALDAYEKAATEENTAVGYGVFYNEVDGLREVVERDQTIAPVKKQQLWGRLNDLLFLLSKRAYDLNPHSSHNCYDYARQLFFKALKPEAIHERTELLCKSKELYQKAIDLLAKEQLDQPAYAQRLSMLYQGLARTLFELRRLNEAKETWSVSVELETGPIGHLQFSSVLSHPEGLDDPRAALEEYQKALQMLRDSDGGTREQCVEWMAGDGIEIFGYLGEAAWALGHVDKAVPLLFAGTFLRKNPTIESSYGLLGDNAQKKKLFSLARYAFLAAIRWSEVTDTYRVKNLLRLGFCAAQCGKWAESVEAYTQAKPTRLDDLSALNDARCHVNQGETGVQNSLDQAILQEVRYFGGGESPLVQYQQTSIEILELLKPIQDLTQLSTIDLLCLVDALRCYNEKIEETRQFVKALAQRTNEWQGFLPLNIAARILLVNIPIPKQAIRSGRKSRIRCPKCDTCS